MVFNQKSIEELKQIIEDAMERPQFNRMDFIEDQIGVPFLGVKLGQPVPIEEETLEGYETWLTKHHKGDSLTWDEWAVLNEIVDMYQ